jgi:radical SAM superfamily enzyme YgiQ (UPF0313 family)
MNNILWIIDRAGIEPLGILQLAGIAKEHGWTSHLCDLSRDDPLEMARDCDLICYSATSGQVEQYALVNRKIKAHYPDIRTAIGGVHASWAPEATREMGHWDIVGVGECDLVFKDILDGQDGIVYGTAPDYLPNIPDPDRDFYYRHTWTGQFGMKSFLAGRGCGYSACTYCFESQWKKMHPGIPKRRRRRPKQIVDEMVSVMKKWPMKFIKIYDDELFSEDDKWLRLFCELYRRHVGLPFHFLCRAESMTPELATLMKATGAVSVSMSIESGNEYIRNKVYRRNQSEQQIIDGFANAKRAGLHVFSNGIFAAKEASYENDIETVDLTIKAGADFSEFGFLNPYAGTAIHKDYVKKGYISDKAHHYSYAFDTPVDHDEKHKTKLRTLSLLGTIGTVWPWLWPTLKKFLWVRPNWLMIICYHAAKNHSLLNEIYPFKRTWREKVKIWLWGLKTEFKRRKLG